MDTKTGNKRAQVLPHGGGLSGGVYKNFSPLVIFFNLILFPKNSPIFSPLKCVLQYGIHFGSIVDRF